MVSGILHTGFVLLQHGYAQGDISVVYPLARGTGPALSVLLALLILGERPGWLAVLGAAVVVGGVVLIGLSGSTPTPGRGRGKLGAGVLYGVLTGVTIAAYTLWDAHSVLASGLAVFPIALMWGSSMTEVVLLAPFALQFTRQGSFGLASARARSADCRHDFPASLCFGVVRATNGSGSDGCASARAISGFCDLGGSFFAARGRAAQTIDWCWHRRGRRGDDSYRLAELREHPICYRIVQKAHSNLRYCNHCSGRKPCPRLDL